MFKLFKISGDSLFPFYEDGERVFCKKVFSFTQIKVNDTIVFRKKDYKLMIKRVKEIQGEKYFVQGTVPLSIDSRNFGTISIEEIKYKVLFKI